MPTMNIIQAVNSALDTMLERDPDVIIFGEDVGYFGGVFRATEGLQRKHGVRRVFDTPIAEAGIMGIAVGMAAYGLRPVAEVQFADYIYPATDQLVSEAARLRYRSGGEFTAPLTVRSPYGGGIFGGQTHSQSPEAIFTHVCGLKTVIPSNPYDAKGLLISAIEDDDPVIFFEPKRLYNGPFDGHHDKPVTPWSAIRPCSCRTGSVSILLPQSFSGYSFDTFRQRCQESKRLAEEERLRKEEDDRRMRVWMVRHARETLANPNAKDKQKKEAEAIIAMYSQPETES